VLSPKSLPAINKTSPRRFVCSINSAEAGAPSSFQQSTSHEPSREANISRSIVLVTDGYISGEKGVFDYIRENLDQCNVFAFGIGTAVNRYLIEGGEGRDG